MNQPPPDNTTELVDRVTHGDESALGRLLDQYRDRLLRMISLRMHPRLRRRLDPVDVLQEANLQAMARIEDYAKNQEMPFYVWLRFITAQKLVELHRRHLGVRARDANREVSIYAGPLPHATSAVLAAQLLGHNTSPSEAAERVEMQLRLQEVLNNMSDIDREIIALRHLEQLSNVETAEVLGIATTAASNRHIRALKRLRAVIDTEWQDTMDSE